MWIKDEDFIRSKVPMTKFETRIISLALLDIKEGDVLLDIGAGTGSISVQASKLGVKVIAVEKDKDAIEVFKRNIEKFNVDIQVINKRAEDVILNLDFDKCFIGGTDGNINFILELIDKKLKKGGIIVANFVTNKYIQMVEKLKDYEVEIRLLNISKYDGVLYRANNPIFIVKAVKN
ncbi:precorrin-6Y C5,15-methyltransferase (decarboxylating) subunit CbiT [Caloramator proteoclasticus]|uniref:Cobalt-precorrin-6B (C15)-methyltransferase n=1 Tax=Caloramator proteoclasticus DSM 10124 TaxID=1121262 RepID=A0A1M4S8Y4_9CLOT|nr:precorrin-6Y C5,15-methyltransferase (decarboxylating) subunit CbiT [Caloramator proteoclasticus]SHE28670.1 cobalt-precorrin-6B (C15)-methyltransferase [Caloramator proteoclasticus DSM 10124]